MNGFIYNSILMLFYYFLLNFAPNLLLFCIFSAFLHKNYFSQRLGSQHPNTGRNIQQLLLLVLYSFYKFVRSSCSKTRLSFSPIPNLFRYSLVGGCKGNLVDCLKNSTKKWREFSRVSTKKHLGQQKSSRFEIISICNKEVWKVVEYKAFLPT